MSSLGFKTKAKREQERQELLPVVRTAKPADDENLTPVDILFFKAHLALIDYFEGGCFAETADEIFFERVRELRKAAMLFKEKM